MSRIILFWKQCFHIKSVKVKIVKNCEYYAPKLCAKFQKFRDPSCLRNPLIGSMKKKKTDKIRNDILYIKVYIKENVTQLVCDPW